MSKIVECVLNFSEGCNKKVIAAIVSAAKNNSEAVQILDFDPGIRTNRTVLSFAGELGAIEESAFQCIKKTVELIDMRQHKGVHPRQGCTDVCPFIPVDNVTMEECVEISKRVGQRVASELGMPVYLYGYSATSEERSNLAFLRKGEYEGLSSKLKTIKPDYGPDEFNDIVKKTGAVCIGARDFLVAYNVNLNTKDVDIANQIGRIIRESGRTEGKDANGNLIKIPGMLKSVKGIGWYIEEYGIAQISFNLTNYNVTPLHVLFETCVKEAEKLGVRVTGGEIVGVLPACVLTEAGKYFLKKAKSPCGVCESELVNIAIKTMGLSEVKPFSPHEKIIENILLKNKNKLCSMRLDDFINTISSKSPAPGGGSVAAAAGAFGVGLGMMVGALSMKDDGEHGAETLSELYAAGEKISKYLEPLKSSIDLDTQAFNEILTAVRLPKNTDENKKIRNEMIQDAYKKATLVPLSVATNCFNAIEALVKIAKLGNPRAISDIGVGALMLQTGFEGAALNVNINIMDISDQQFTKEVLEKLNSMRSGIIKYRDMVLDRVREVLQK